MAQNRQLLVNLIFDPEYHGYVADVPQLPGCMSQGKTVEAAKKNVRQAIRTYLKVAQPPHRRILRHKISHGFGVT